MIRTDKRLFPVVIEGGIPRFMSCRSNYVDSSGQHSVWREPHVGNGQGTILLQHKCCCEYRYRPDIFVPNVQRSSVGGTIDCWNGMSVVSKSSTTVLMGLEETSTTKTATSTEYASKYDSKLHRNGITYKSTLAGNDGSVGGIKIDDPYKYTTQGTPKAALQIFYKLLVGVYNCTITQIQIGVNSSSYTSTSSMDIATLNSSDSENAFYRFRYLVNGTSDTGVDVSSYGSRVSKFGNTTYDGSDLDLYLLHLSIPTGDVFNATGKYLYVTNPLVRISTPTSAIFKCFIFDQCTAIGTDTWP